MNALKKNGGFTLVELIVVIAILAILAGVAVPAYSGYITKANAAADLSELSAVYTAASAALAEKGEVTEINVSSKSSVKAKIGESEYDLLSSVTTGDIVKIAASFKDFYGSTAPELKTGDTATWKDGSWTITKSST